MNGKPHIGLETSNMSIDQPTSENELLVRARFGRMRLPKVAHYILVAICGIFVSVIVPLLLALFGIGMSRQSESVALNAAAASLLAMVVSFFVIRRFLNFPLLRTYSYA